MQRRVAGHEITLHKSISLWTSNQEVSVVYCPKVFGLVEEAYNICLLPLYKYNNRLLSNRMNLSETTERESAACHLKRRGLQASLSTA